MTHETVLIGPLTRDFTLRDRLRWSQPGGAVWHAGLALALTGARVSVYGTAEPWAGRYGLPGLAGAGIAWRGINTAIETTFVNRCAWRAGRADRRVADSLSACW